MGANFGLSVPVTGGKVPLEIIRNIAWSEKQRIENNR